MFRRLFGGNKDYSAPALPEEDALALRSLQNDWQCSSCGEWHRGVMHLGAEYPDPWPHGSGAEPNSALRTDGDFLSEDFCVIDGEHFMVRCVLEIPVIGLDEPWTWGCWSSLSRENFDKYVAGFDSGDFEDNGPCFGWLCNTLPPLRVAGEPLAVEVWPLTNRQRPLLVVEDSDHQKSSYLGPRVSDFPRSNQVMAYDAWDETIIAARTADAAALVLAPPPI